MSSLPSSPATLARYIMIGGFLGAGKTTAVARLAAQLTAQGRRVGLITNDQGSELVDTAMLRARGFATAEIAGGCFCCRFNSLVEAAEKLSADQAPDVFIAEPVGSCTDLVATVSYPLRRIYGNRYSIAPLSVLVDPIRARRVLALQTDGNFSEKIRYIYRKQLEEADLIVINKADLLTAEALQELPSALENEFPGKEYLAVSTRNGDGLEAWFGRIAQADSSQDLAMEVDYERYAEGEALLGWLNATVLIRAETPQNGNQIIEKFATEMQQNLALAKAEIAHLKMTLSPDDSWNDLAIINVVRNDFVPELSQTLEDAFPSGRLIVNVRAEASPDQLKAALEHAIQHLQSSELTLAVEHLEHFRPGKPTPTHRLTSAV